MKYSVTLHQYRERVKLVLESRAGESDRHITLKVLAYLLFRDETDGLPLRIEQGVGQRHKPDLVATEPETGRVRVWVDCGQIETKRLGRIAAANPGAQVIVVKSTAGEAAAYARAAARYLPPDPERRAAIRYLGFDEEFVSGFRSLLRGANDVVVTARTDDTLAITLNEEPLSTTLVFLGA